MSECDGLYRACVGLMLLNRSGEVFVGRRLDYPSGYWQMPQGGIEQGEEPLAAAMREMREEIGSANARLLATHPEWLKYDLPASLRADLWEGRYRGQRQKWHIFRFLGEDSELNVATAEPEFSAWRWLPLTDLVDSIVPFKAQVYASVVSFAQEVLSSRDEDPLLD